MNKTPLESWIARKINCSPLDISRQKIEDYQLEKIKQVLHFVKQNNSFYQGLYKNISPEINTFKEFSQLPFTTEDDLRQNPSKFLCVSQNEISRVVTLDTSGTSGQSKRCFFTPEDQELTIDFFGSGMSTLVTTGDRVLILLPDRTPGSVGDLLFQGLTRIGVLAHKHGPVTNLDETLQTICQMDINCLVGVPVQVLALVRYQQKMPQKYPVNLKSILLSTDYVPESIVKIIQESWHCEVFNHYGMTEMGLGGGVFCEGQYGYHLREADMYFEIIDPVTGQTLPDSEMGEVVFTTLTRQGMPLIRYRTGDYSRFLSDPCPCGTVLKSLQKINGRVIQRFTINGQTLLIADLDEIIFPLDGIINYRLVIKHELPDDTLAFTIFILNKELTSLKNDIISALISRGLITASQSIFFTIIEGYPEELWSLRKRKVEEEYLNQVSQNY
jgi:phenylacetate-CoA ligase